MSSSEFPAGAAPTAQADVLGGDASQTAPAEGPLPASGQRREPQNAAATTASPSSQPGDARPGRDENQAGFLKDNTGADERPGR